MANYVTLQTEDSLEYRFFPALCGSVLVKVRASNDAHIVLAASSASDQAVEIILGGWGNTKSVIRRSKTHTEKAVLPTPDILDATEYRAFLIKWEGNVISVGNEDEDKPFLSYTKHEPFVIRYVGVCTAYGASGSWKVDDDEAFETPDKLEYVYRPVTAGFLDFEYRGPHNCHILLTTGPSEMEPLYEIILGDWKNKRSVLKRNHYNGEKVTVETPGLLDPEEFKQFMVEWRNGSISVVNKTTGAVLMQWTDPAPFLITHFGVRTAYGAAGHWRIKN